MVSELSLETAVCIECGYSLRGLPKPVCPECGREFDPGDPATFRDASKPSFWSRFAAPPSMWGIAAVILITAANLNRASIPLAGLPLDITGDATGNEGDLTFCLLPLLTPILLLSYALRLVLVCRSDRHIRDITSGRSQRKRWRWLVLPACAILVITAIVHPWPLQVRFALSRRSFEQAAQQSLARTWPTAGPQWIGFYKVEEINIRDTTVRFLVGHQGPIDKVFVIYDPAAKSKGTSLLTVPGQADWYMCVDY